MSLANAIFVKVSVIRSLAFFVYLKMQKIVKLTLVSAAEDRKTYDKSSKLKGVT